MARDRTNKGHVRKELTPEEKAAVLFYMKVQMENEQRQEIGRRAAEAAREEKFRLRAEANEAALKRLEAEKEEGRIAFEKKRAEELEMIRKADAKKLMDIFVEQKMKEKAMREAEELNRRKREESAERGAKMAILLHPEYKKMTQKAQAFVQKLGNSCVEKLARLNEGENFRLKMEKECRLLC